MYKRTFEVLSKYISSETGVTIQFDTGGGAHADMDTNTLHLPKEIANSHAYAAVSLMMHESAHIAHSKKIPIKDIVKTKADFSILNAIEDVRIDCKNFNVLPNIHSFYQELINDVKANVDPKLDLPAKAICWAILRLEGFSPNYMYGLDGLRLGKKVANIIQTAQWDIECDDWNNLRENIAKIKKLLKINDPPMKQDQINKLQMGQGIDGPLGKVESQIRPDKVFAKGQGDDKMAGGSGSEVGSIAMEEMNISQFKEILNVKERKISDNGSILDTDSLISFKTGDVGELFKEERVVKKKKSKIMFLLDASGSMGTKLFDGQKRAAVVAKSVATLTNILDEVATIEGLNVDWGVGMFRSDYIPLSKDTWQQRYNYAGGTKFEEPFNQVMNEMLTDYTIDGKRIIIVLTDGDVLDQEIANVKENIMRNFSDVRSLIISVGSDAQSAIVKDITGDNTIMAEDNAVSVIMTTIKSLL